MSDRLSGNAEMSDAATLAEGLVKECASPVSAGESIKAQMRRSASRLRRSGLSGADGKVKRAWYGEAGAKTYLEIKAAFDRWQARDRRALVSGLQTLRDTLNATDQDLYGSDIERLGEAIRALGGVAGSSGGEA